MYALHKWGCQYHCHQSADVWSPRGCFSKTFEVYVMEDLSWCEPSLHRRGIQKPQLGNLETWLQWKTGALGRREVTKTTRDCIKDKNPNPVLSLTTKINFLNPSPTRKFHSLLVSIEEAIIIFPTSTVCSLHSIQPRGSLSAPITASEQQTLQASFPWKDAADNNS